LPAEQISGEILKRQELGSTGTGGGVAIPHARIEGLNRSFGILARPNKPIDFEAIVGRPVDLVFLLLLPANPVGEQLKALAQHWAASALKPFRCVLALLAEYVRALAARSRRRIRFGGITNRSFPSTRPSHRLTSIW
jgi:hypothetical protein